MGHTSVEPDFGVDAPGVVRNLIIAAVLCLAVWIAALLHVLPPVVGVSIGPVRLSLAPGLTGLFSGGGCALMAGWMLWSGKGGKVRERESLLQHIAWTGTERVLDVGCGRGLMLIGAAMRLTTGKATGIDIWQAEDLSGNRPDATQRNIELAGLADRAEIQTADMRAIPFPDGTFDVIVSRAAIHNVYASSDRQKVIAEIARVLKPGGQALIEDIRHQREYVAAFAANGCRQVRWIGSPIVRVALGVITLGSLSPATILITKDR